MPPHTHTHTHTHTPTPPFPLFFPSPCVRDCPLSLAAGILHTASAAPLFLFQHHYHLLRCSVITLLPITFRDTQMAPQPHPHRPSPYEAIHMHISSLTHTLTHFDTHTLTHIHTHALSLLCTS